jgi:ComEC/Rec2-related protein
LYLVIVVLSSINVSVHEPFAYEYHGREARFSGTVIAEERNPRYGKLFIQLHEAYLNNKIYRCEMPVEYYIHSRDVYLGKNITVLGRLVGSRYAHRPRLLTGTLAGAGEPGSWQGAIIHRVRNYIEKTLTAFFDPGHSALSSGLVLGGSGRLYPELKEVFARAGVLHVFAVSGLHVGFVCAFVGALLLWVPISPKIKFALVMMVLCLYAAITGFRPSVCRAVLMAFLFGLSLVLQRNVDPVHVTTMSAIVFLVANPLVLFDVGAQLSFAAVYGIVLIYPVIRDKVIARVKSRIAKYFLIPLGISFAAQVCVWPLLVFYFRRLPTLAVFANLFIVPLASITIFLLFSLLIMNTLFAFGAQILAVIVSGLLHVLVFISTVLARIPFATVTLFISPVFLVLIYGLYTRKTRPYAVGASMCALFVWAASSLWTGVMIRAAPDAVLVTLPHAERVFIAPEKNVSAQHALLHDHNDGAAEYVIAADRTLTATKKFYRYPDELFKLHMHTKDITIACDKTVRVTYQGGEIFSDYEWCEDPTDALYILSDGKKTVRFTSPLYGTILDHIIRDLRVTLAKIQLL